MSANPMQAHWADAGEQWVQNERAIDAAFAPFTRAVLDAARLDDAHRALDVGCGAGTLLAALQDAEVDAVGVDISAAMVDAARARVPAATVLLADAQTEDLLGLAPGSPFDRVVSRFGVMFFEDPVAAFANLRRATTPDATMAFVCWRQDATEVFLLGLDPLLARLEDPPAPPPPGSPGPLGLADPDTVLAVLQGAGWSSVSVEPLDAVCDFGVDGSDGVEERLAVALGGMVGRAARARLEPELGPDGWAELLEVTRAELRASIEHGSVRVTGRTWLVTASA